MDGDLFTLGEEDGMPAPGLAEEDLFSLTGDSVFAENGDTMVDDVDEDLW